MKVQVYKGPLRNLRSGSHVSWLVQSQITIHVLTVGLLCGVLLVFCQDEYTPDEKRDTQIILSIVQSATTPPLTSNNISVS
jgi:hypothetical protein